MWGIWAAVSLEDLVDPQALGDEELAVLDLLGAELEPGDGLVGRHVLLQRVLAGLEVALVLPLGVVPEEGGVGDDPGRLEGGGDVAGGRPVLDEDGHVGPRLALGVELGREPDSRRRAGRSRTGR